MIYRFIILNKKKKSNIEYFYLKILKINFQ